MKCIYCEGNIVWGSDFDTEDYGIERQGIVSNYTCSECEAEYQTIRWFEDEQ